tara:strand:- start:20520 stop:22946 length:2427 start_codon:yes stop_codon:yes gene_type:complete
LKYKKKEIKYNKEKKGFKMKKTKIALTLSLILTTFSATSNNFVAIIGLDEIKKNKDNVQETELPYIKFKEIEVAGNQYSSASFAIDVDNNLWATGLNSNNRLGLDKNTRSYNEWTKTNSDNVIKISASHDFTMKLLSNGDLYAIGLGREGNFGEGKTLNHENWIKLPFKNPKDFKAITGSSYVIDSNGKLWVAGYNQDNQLGIIGGYQENNWIEITTITEELKTINVSRGSAIALDTKNQMWVAGNNNKGQLGTGDTANVTTWRKLLQNNVESVSMGSSDYWELNGYSFFKSTSGDYYHTGSSIGSKYPYSESWNKDLNTNMKQIIPSDTSPYSYGIDNENKLYAIGNNLRNQSGIKNANTFLNEWTDTNKKVKAARAAGDFGVIIDESGYIWVTGDNKDGQIGIEGSPIINEWTKPLIIDPDSDLDNDGVKDIDEIKSGTNPRDKDDTPVDTDGDGIFDPNDNDIDGDGFYNEEEENSGTNKMLSNSYPRKIYAANVEQSKIDKYSKRVFKIEDKVTFYDDGKEFGNYSDETNGIYTFIPPKGKKIAINIKYLKLSNPDLYCCNTVSDTLKLYKKGVNDEGYLEYENIIMSFPSGRSNAEVNDFKYVSNNSEDGSLTFEWYTPAGTDGETSKGWEIEVMPLDNTDTDNDSIPDFLDEDDDNDGVPDSVEISKGTDPLDPLDFPPIINHPKNGSITFKINGNKVDYYDDAGDENKYYSQEVDSYITFVSENSGKKLKATIKEIEIDDGYHYLSIYNGERTDTKLDTLTGDSHSDKEYISDENGKLTFHFTSDDYVESLGWHIEIEEID